MWCKQCRQDVPGVPSKSGKPRCLRCGVFITGDVAVDDSSHFAEGVQAMAEYGLDLDPGKSDDAKPEMDFDDWDFDPDLRSFKKTQAAYCATKSSAGSSAGEHPFNLNAPAYQAWQSQMHLEQRLAGPAYQTAASSIPQPKRTSWLAWAVTSLGMMAFTCGGVLLGWSYVSGREDLWNLGVPAAVGGQIALLIGLVLQLERIWQSHRYAVDKMEEVDERLADMKQSQSLMRVNHGSASQAFYAHMAEGASPSLLLADLKGQLDLLAVRLSDRR